MLARRYPRIRLSGFGAADEIPPPAESVPSPVGSRVATVSLFAAVALLAYRAGQSSTPGNAGALRTMLTSYLGWRALDAVFQKVNE
ncbi:MAG: hypothetical protein KA310_03485 [Pseudomonadales bacterium]|nr:hypothetical protein [Pseudomonadales bacterium]